MLFNLITQNINYIIDDSKTQFSAKWILNLICYLPVFAETSPEWQVLSDKFKEESIFNKSQQTQCKEAKNKLLY